MWSPRRLALSMTADPTDAPKPSFVRMMQALKMASDANFSGKIGVTFKRGKVSFVSVLKEYPLNEWQAVNAANGITAQLDTDDAE